MAAKNIFERLLGKGRPPVEEAIKQPEVIQHAQRILDFLQRWNGSTVRIKDLNNHGPRPRDRESLLTAAAVLVENGWLIEIPVNRYDGHTWQIVRKPIVRPCVAVPTNPRSHVALDRTLHRSIL